MALSSPLPPRIETLGEKWGGDSVNAIVASSFARKKRSSFHTQGLCVHWNKDPSPKRGDEEEVQPEKDPPLGSSFDRRGRRDVKIKLSRSPKKCVQQNMKLLVNFSALLVTPLFKGSKRVSQVPMERLRIITAWSNPKRYYKSEKIAVSARCTAYAC